MAAVESNKKAKSIRSFIGAKNYEESIRFYEMLGFTRNDIPGNMIYFAVNDKLGFYLQNYYKRSWVNNSMIFLEVEDLDSYYQELLALELPSKFKVVKLSPIKTWDWGRECFLHDPSGILWHIGEFNS